MRRLVIGDIHGCYNALIQVLERSKFDYENDLLITIGDIVDGWSDSYKCVEHLLTIENRIDIIGNHDLWFNDFINKGIHGVMWKGGGLTTAKSYAKAAGVDFKATEGPEGWICNLNSGDIPEDHKKFFRGQHKYYKDENDILFVHGGINPSIPLKEHLLYNLMWDRHLWSKHLEIMYGHSKEIEYLDDINRIFIGHTSTTASGFYQPVIIDKLINLDTGAGGSGYLSIMDVDTGDFWQSDYVPDLYPDEL